MDTSDLRDFARGHRLRAAELQVHVDLLREHHEVLSRKHEAPFSCFDPDGWYQRRQPGAGGQWKFAKLNGDLEGGAGNKVSASVWKLNDAEDDWEDIGNNLDDVYAPPLLADGDTLDSGTWVIVHKHSDGKWYVTNAACD